MSKEVELKNCPCCNGKVEFGVIQWTDDDPELWIKCKCGLTIHDESKRTEEDLAKAWNTRPQDSVLEELQATQERIEILGSENQQLKMEFNSVLEDIEGDIKDKYVKADYCCFKSVDGALAILAKHKTGEGL